MEWAQENSENVPLIKVIGVGGAGGNVINNMIKRRARGCVTYIAANTDRQALERSDAEIKIQLGTTGLGAGAKPEVGAQAANEARDEIRDHLAGAQMVFITAGMGGGTGTGASPIIAEVAHELGILTVAIVTKPFSFEGSRRMKIAEGGIAQLKSRVSSMVVILNDRLEEELGGDATVKDCFEKADEVLYNACSGIAEIVESPGLINVDFNDVCTVMGERGTALMGAGEAVGEDRAATAASMAISCPLLEGVQLAGAKGLLINVTASDSLKMSEARTVVETIKNFADQDVNIVWGTVFDSSLGDKLRVTVIATGLDQNGIGDDFDQPTRRETSFWDTQSAPAARGTTLIGDPLPETATRNKEHKNEPAQKPSFLQQANPKPVQPARTQSQPQPQYGTARTEKDPVAVQAKPAPERPTGVGNQNNMFGHVQSRPISQPDTIPFPVDENEPMLFGSAQKNGPSVGGVSNLWTRTVPKSVEPQVKVQPDSAAKEEKKEPDFDSGIPAFLRKNK